jgi:hypothetical protein
MGDDSAPNAAQVSYPIAAEADLGGDRLVEHLNPDGSVFFAAVPSADFVRVSEANPSRREVKGVFSP